MIPILTALHVLVAVIFALGIRLGVISVLIASGCLAAGLALNRRGGKFAYFVSLGYSGILVILGAALAGLSAWGAVRSGNSELTTFIAGFLIVFFGGLTARNIYGKASTATQKKHHGLPSELEMGKGVDAILNKDYVTAFHILKPLATQGHAEAQTRLGGMYANGMGVPQDYKEAVNWYRQAAAQGHPFGQTLLGVMYALGQGVPLDHETAVEWYRLAAQQGDATGQTCLGTMYANGLGVPQNYEEAVTWHRLAAAQGNSHAQTNLGVMYAKGEGVPESHVAAYALLNLSSSSSVDNDADNLRDADNLLARLAERMSAREIKVAQDLARKMANPGNLLVALDQYFANDAAQEQMQSLLEKRETLLAEAESPMPVFTAAEAADFDYLRGAQREVYAANPEARVLSRLLAETRASLFATDNSETKGKK